MKVHTFVITAIIYFLFFTSCSKKSEAPIDLMCEFKKNPIGLEVEYPRFSWKLNDTTQGAMQKAYQIIVASEMDLLDEKNADLWNSGKMLSEKSHLVKYQGDKLRSGKKYYWAVKIWNQKGKESVYSDAASIVTGFLKRNDWKAKWIGKEKEKITKTPDFLGNWIWSSSSVKPNEEVFFRKNFYLPEEPIKEAYLRVTADEQFSVYLNEKYIGNANNWKQFYFHEISNYLNGNENTISFRVKNGEDNRAGLIFSLHITYEGGYEQFILSDETTLVSSKKPGEDWRKIAFKDDTWGKARIIAPYGRGVWRDSVEVIDPRKSVLLRKEFQLKKEIQSARIFATGLGGYYLSINSQRIGNDLLTPGWTHYTKKLQYQVYDISNELKKGDNVIGVTLGNIWWSSGLGWNGGAFYSNGPLRFLAQLEIIYEDGSRERIITDESWKSHYSPITYNTLYHGEIYDAREEQNGWGKTGFDSNNWDSAKVFQDLNPKLVAQYSPPIQITETLKAQSISEPKPGVFVFDYGQNMVGRGRLKISGENGQKIIMRFAELLHDDGTVAQENLRMAKATDVYICKGKSVENWAPDFVYHGFRYVQIEGLKKKPSKDVLVGEVFHNNAMFSGEFISSNKLINQIWENITWGQRGNMMSVPTDCPQRDERLGWMGDAQIFAPTANYTMNMANFWAKWVADIVDCQEPEGWVYDVNPAIVVEGPSKPGWGDAIIITPWMSYLFYGDKNILKENYHGMKAWVEYMRSKSHENIYEWGEGEWGGYGDWVAVESSPTKPIGGIYYYYSTKLLSKIAKILGYESDAAEYSKLLPEIAKAYHEKYFNTNTNQYEGETQTANLLPIAVGITPEELKGEVFENFLKNILEHDKHLTTGFLGTAFLLPELSKHGQHDLAYEIATQETYPSWGYMVKNGATTMWELWNSDTERPEGMNSRNHFAYGSVGEWYFGYLAGIQPMEEYPGFKKFKIAPYVPDQLEHAGATYESPYGKIASYWKKTKDSLQISVTIPANSSAEVYIPFEEYDKIMEGKTVLYNKGKSYERGDIIFLGRKDSFLVFDVLAGKYTFVVN